LSRLQSGIYPPHTSETLANDSERREFSPYAADRPAEGSIKARLRSQPGIRNKKQNEVGVFQMLQKSSTGFVI